MENSVWNDDLKTWRLPTALGNTIKLPITNPGSSFQIAKNNIFDANDNKFNLRDSEDSDLSLTGSPENYKINILKNYFRPNRKNIDQHAQRTNKSQDYMREFTAHKRASMPVRELQATALNKIETFNQTFEEVDNSSGYMDKKNPTPIT